MSTLQIPMFLEASFTEQVTLENTPYNFRFAWNDRFKYWTMDIFTDENILIIAGIRLVVGIEFLRDHPDIGLPPGQLVVIDIRNPINDPVYADFTNGNCFLLYQESV